MYRLNALLVAIGLIIVLSIYPNYAGKNRLISLLQGHPNADLKSIRFKGQMRDVYSDSPEIIDYLNSQMKHARFRSYIGPDLNMMGYSYMLEMVFNDGSKFRCDVTPSFQKNGLTVSFRLNSWDILNPEDVFYAIDFKEPVPDEVDAMFRALNSM